MKTVLSFSRSIIVIIAFVLNIYNKDVNIYWVVIWSALALLNIIFDYQYYAQERQEGTYVAEYLYFLKSSTQIALVVFAFLVLDFGVVLFIKMIPVWVVYLINTILVLALLLFVFMVVTSKVPSLTFDDKGFLYRRKQIEFNEIKKLIPASGGSEPELEFHEGDNMVLELSWFSKANRNAILQTIQNNING